MKNNFLNKTKLGFTLVEILVVISIIGILAGIVLIGPGNARQRARDAKREADIMEIQWAMERYYNDHYEYPSELGQLAPPNNSYLPSIPEDPSGEEYSSQVATDMQSYCIWAELERGEYLAVSEKGYGFTNEPPSIGSCW